MECISTKIVEMLFIEPKFGVSNDLVDEENHLENNIAIFESVCKQNRALLLKCMLCRNKR